jgi:hypothetical protein
MDIRFGIKCPNCGSTNTQGARCLHGNTECMDCNKCFVVKFPPKTSTTETIKAESIKDGLEACIRGKLTEGNRSQNPLERIARKRGRDEGKYEKKPGIKIPEPIKRIPRKMVRRTGSKYNGNPKPKIEISDNKQRLIIAAKFLKDNYNRNDQELSKLVSAFPYKHELYSIVDHMIATALGGWHKEGDQLVNETGHIANKENWILENDIIKSKNGKKLECIDILLAIRGLIHESKT